MVPVWFISRASDLQRQKTFTDGAAKLNITASKIDAFDAHRPDFPFGLYADLIGSHFWGEDRIKPGAIGCFLSHRKAWQNLVDSGLDAALICEDDIELTEGLGRVISAASAIHGLDILFANDRLASWAAAPHPGQPTVPITETVQALARIGGPKEAGLKVSPGADCYLLTRCGAEKLLALTKDQRIVCGVDWAMVWNGLASVDGETVNAFPALDVLQRTLGLTAAPLNAHVLTEAVSRLVPGPSVLKHAIDLPIAHLINRNPQLAHTEYVATLDVGGAQLSFAGRSGPDPVMEAHRTGDLWDEAGIKLLLERFPAGGTFVDIGAHLGNHTVAVGKLGAAGKILSIEANAEIYNILRANIAMNGLSRIADVAPGGLALGSSAGEAWILLNRRKSSETMVKKDRPDEGGPKIRTTLMTGDDWIGDQPVHAIKIDTAGTEVDILRGLRRTIATQKPIMLIDHSSGSFERIERLAGEMGMHVVATVPSSRKRRDSSLLISRPGG